MRINPFGGFTVKNVNFLLDAETQALNPATLKEFFVAVCQMFFLYFTTLVNISSRGKTWLLKRDPRAQAKKC